jgi:Raf kinase inhibitor-like YbhB/YbcL family protein
MKITSNSFTQSSDNTLQIPPKFTCDGENINPHLAWSDIPPGTKSFALMIDDPDASAGIWCHVLIYNIPPNVNEIAEGFLANMQWNLGYNSWNKREYGGPCPPSGVHHYVFHLYAFDRMLEESPTRKWDRISFLRYIQEEHPEQLLDTAEFIATYRRNE